jgi:ADP-ribose pyrophosphatase YjhB (NUDIX family)
MYTNHANFRNNPSAGGIIYDPINDKLLVVKGPIKWSLPKGHREPTEHIHETAMREIFEETSIKVDLNNKSKYKKILKCIYYFIIFENGEKNHLTWIDHTEISEIKWFTIYELYHMNCNRQLNYLINRWKHIKHIFTKLYDQLMYHITLYPPEILCPIIQEYNQNKTMMNQIIQP